MIPGPLWWWRPSRSGCGAAAQPLLPSASMPALTARASGLGQPPPTGGSCGACSPSRKMPILRWRPWVNPEKTSLMKSSPEGLR